MQKVILEHSTSSNVSDARKGGNDLVQATEIQMNSIYPTGPERPRMKCRRSGKAVG